jgi:Spaetzle
MFTKIRALFILQKTSEAKAMILDYDQDYSASFSSESSESQCLTVQHIITPDDLLNSLAGGHRWEFDKEFQQSIHVNKCENTNGSCIGYPFVKTRCRQRFLTIKLLVFERNKELSRQFSSLKKFRIPSDCECVI